MISAATSTIVIVGPSANLHYELTVPATAVSGIAVNATVTAKDEFGNGTPGFRGAVVFTSTGTALLPSLTFAGPEGGTATVSVTFLSSGSQTLTATTGAVTGSATIAVTHSAETTYVLSALPATAVAGQALGLVIQVADNQGNLSADYTGTAHFSSADASDRLPSDCTFAAGRCSVALIFTSSGGHQVTVTDQAESITTAQTSLVSVTADAKQHYELALPSDAVSGVAVNATVTAKDEFGNGVPGYTGTVIFTSTGTAVLPSLTFAGTEGGTATVLVTFNSLGTQTLTATTGAVTGSAVVHVHGLGYTNPAASLGKVQLVYNAAASTTTVVQLDLVTAVPLLNAFGAGMNLPVDSTKVTLDATPLANDTSVFNPGAQFTQADGGISSPDLPLAEAAALNSGVAYTGVSSKIVANPAGGTPLPNGFWVNQDAVGIPAGTVLYSMRVAMLPAATPGTVFDGAALGAKFRAAVRDQLGNDTVVQSDFGIGKLEVK